MKTLFLILALLVAASAAEKLVFEDHFDELNLKTWEHELTMSGGGNWEFEWYVNNRSNTYVKNGVLYIKPTYTEDAIGTEALNSGDINIWGGAPADSCTNNGFYGCERNAAASGNPINPVRSARLRTSNSFNFKYGRVEVKAQLPKGDWLWPAIWMLPRYNNYGLWPASGEIDIMESRGNDPSYPAGGHDSFGSTLHWGTNYDTNKFEKTHETYKNAHSLGDGFHTYGLYWDQNQLYTYIDNENTKVLQVDFTKQSFWERGQFSPNLDNPWVSRPNAAPFDQEFYLVFNLAVGGTANYFPEGMGNKPWSNTSPKSVSEFWNAKGTWQPSWQGENAALKIDSVKVWSLDSAKKPLADDFMAI